MGRKFTENNIHFSLSYFFPTQTDGAVRLVEKKLQQVLRGGQVTAIQQLLSLQEIKGQH